MIFSAQNSSFKKFLKSSNKLSSFRTKAKLRLDDFISTVGMVLMLIVVGVELIDEIEVENVLRSGNRRIGVNIFHVSSVTYRHDSCSCKCSEVDAGCKDYIKIINLPPSIPRILFRRVISLIASQAKVTTIETIAVIPTILSSKSILRFS